LWLCSTKEPSARGIERPRRSLTPKSTPRPRKLKEGRPSSKPRFFALPKRSSEPSPTILGHERQPSRSLCRQSNEETRWRDRFHFLPNNINTKSEKHALSTNNASMDSLWPRGISGQRTVMTSLYEPPIGIGSIIVGLAKPTIMI